MKNGDDRLIINTFGPFSVVKGNVNLTNKYRRSKKPWLLLKYLIAHKDRLTSTDILAETICPEQEPDNPGQLIHNLVYRLRKMLEEDLSVDNRSSAVIFENGGYRWNSTDSNLLDTEQFEDLYKKAIFQSTVSSDEAILYFKKALELYKADFLAENVSEEWTQSSRAYYHNIFLKAVHSVINLLNLVGNYDEIIEICKSSFLIDYYDTDLHVEYLKALLEKDYTRQALTHYEEATGKLYLQAGIAPSSEMTAIYKSIKKGKRNTQFRMIDIQNELINKSTGKGALLCDIDVFSHIYNLEKKRVERQSYMYSKSDDKTADNRQSIFLMLLSVVYDETDPKYQEVLDREMKRITEVLVKTLRSSDVISKWSAGQFVLLLCGLQAEHTELVYKRIVDTYNQEYPKSGIKLLRSIGKL